MEYIILAIALLILFMIYLIRCMIEDRRGLKRLERSLHQDYGKPSAKKYAQGRLETIAGHYRKHKAEFSLDDITWNDLDMGRVFRSMDFTLSAAGEESLYTMLRCPSVCGEELEKREELINYFMQHEQDRVKLQMFFARVGRTGKYSIYDYVEYMDSIPQKKNTGHYAMLVFMLLALLFCFYDVGYGLFVFCLLVCANLLTYFKEKKFIDPYITTFAYFLRVLQVEKQLAGCGISIIQEQIQNMENSRKKFVRFSRFSGLLMHQNTMSGNPLDVIVDYLRMAFHLNLIKFNTMLKEAKTHKQDIISIIETMGNIEAMISIGAYRKSLPYYTVPELEDKKISEDKMEPCDNQMTASEIYHPLLTNAVANSVSLTSGMLITGSNASGKSTFLKTIAIAQILSQTIHTVPAKQFFSGFYRVYTSMALRDDLAGSDSYFIVEIKSLKRIIDSTNDNSRVMCFVDEVLRGTNTVERIAASTEILGSLAQKHIFTFAATHDIELTTLLSDSYANYHFEEKIEHDDVKFNYMLCMGKATSRNAIKLLGVLGYEDEIIDRAEKRAADFVEYGEWK